MFECRHCAGCFGTTHCNSGTATESQSIQVAERKLDFRAGKWRPLVSRIYYKDMTPSEALAIEQKYLEELLTEGATEEMIKECEEVMDSLRESISRQK